MNPAEREISQLYQRLGPVVYRRALKLLQHREDAADATQQVFLKLLQNAQLLRGPPERAVPYLLEVTSNHCFNLLRDRRRRARRLESTGSAGEEATRDLERETGDRQAAARVLKKLELHGADVAARVLVAEHDHRAVADQLGISEKTVQRKLRRFIDSAKKLLTREG